jgi:3-hydroxybutyryl-CoA dehydrogenase
MATSTEGRPNSKPKSKAGITKIGVVGSGQMGNGIAHVCALKGYDIYLMDASKDGLKKGLAAIDHNLGRQVGRKLISKGEKATALKRIASGTTYTPFKDCNLVIEAATENEQVKKDIYKKLCPVLNKDAYIATNTSSISVTRLAAQTDRPDKFIGMHFMNPVPVMELVELIRGITTEESTFSVMQELVLSLDKIPVSAEDFPAFIVNRILLPMINEAIYTLYEGVGNVDAIDRAMQLGAHHPMGPLELADFIGLDTCLSVMNVLHEGLADTKYRPCPLLVKYVEAGWLGRKAGRGFYDYTTEPPVPTR